MLLLAGSACEARPGSSGEAMDPMDRVLVVVGGGIAGLAAAHRLVENARARGVPAELTVFEAADRLGGTIRTERRDGFLVEGGPDSFISEKPWALALCARIGPRSRLVGTDDRFRRTYVVRGGRLHPLPDGFLLLAPTRLAPFVGSRLFSWRGKLRMALDLVLPRGGGRGREPGQLRQPPPRPRGPRARRRAPRRRASTPPTPSG